MVVQRKNDVIRELHNNSSKACHLYLMDFVEIFTSGRYYGDMKILKILTSNSASSEFIVFLKNDNLMMIGGMGGGVVKYYLFLENFCLDVFFDPGNSKTTSKLP